MNGSKIWSYLKDPVYRRIKSVGKKEKLHRGVWRKSMWNQMQIIG